MRHSVTVLALVMGSLLWPLWAGAGQPCEYVPMPCMFEALPFTFKVIDAETGQLLADVHALAEWQMERPGGRGAGPLMVKDTVSGADGLIAFEAWGPIQGPQSGLMIGYDPVVTLFKTGYRTMGLNNGYLPPGQERERVRRFMRKETTYALEPFRGTTDEWLNELDKVWLGWALPRTDQDSLQFRAAYLNRVKRISTERQKFPADRQGGGSFFWHVDRELKLLEEGHR